VNRIDEISEEARIMTPKVGISLILLIVLPFLVQCQAQQATVSPLTTPVSPLDSPLDPPDSSPVLDNLSPPDADKATAYGQAVDAVTQEPLSFMSVRLAEVFRGAEEGAFVLDEATSPGTMTDSEGRFALQNVEPNEYVVIVGDVNVSYGIVATPSGDAQVWDLPAGELVDLGVIEVTLN
jgi:hypothetical protein